MSEVEQECTCGLITPNPDACRCGCGECCPGRVRVAWTIFKLKVVRFFLARLMRLHLWHELRHQRKVHPSHTEGPIGRERIRKAVAQVKKRTKR